MSFISSAICFERIAFTRAGGRIEIWEGGIVILTIFLVQFAGAIACVSDCWQGRIQALNVAYTSAEILVEDGFFRILARVYILVTVARTCFAVEDWVFVVPASLFNLAATTGTCFRIIVRELLTFAVLFFDITDT